MRHPPAVAAALTLALAAACSGGPAAGPTPMPAPTTESPAPTPSPATSDSPSATPTPSPTGSTCPTTYAEPYADRPVVALDVAVASDHRTVTGTQVMTFTPDKPVTEILYRLWANAPRPRDAGGRITVTRATVDGAPVARNLSSGDTLLRLPLPAPAHARPVRIELAFTLRLPVGANERMGSSGGTAWFASATPLLAWERGRGWATEPPTAAFAEATTSEVFRLDELTVTAPVGDVVLATGTRTTGNTFRAAAVRDLMVAVGKFRTATGRTGTTPITVGVAPGLPDDPQRLVALHATSIESHAKRFGPFPYDDLDVAVVPDIGGGIEYPGAILLGSRQDDDPTLSHEVAHEWFYGLVGNNQGRDPWLDESFATYAEALDRGTSTEYLTTKIPAEGRNRVGRPMTYWESRRATYYRSVYVQGAAALLLARAAVGAARFDAAIRCYVAANAHRIATPRDLANALAAYPAALKELRRFGALP